MNRLETTDIFHSAFFLCMGGDLQSVRFTQKNGRTAVFMITGRNLDRHDRDYRTGKARVNPLQLRDSLNRLRDALFAKKREREERKEHRHEYSPRNPQGKNRRRQNRR